MTILRVGALPFFALAATCASEGFFDRVDGQGDRRSSGRCGDALYEELPHENERGSAV